jgi:hypothetical protein
MAIQRYTVTPHPIGILLMWVKSGEVAINDKAPAIYFKELAEQCAGGKGKYGNITDRDELKENLAVNCSPGAMVNDAAPDYDAFLEQRES